MTTDDVPLWGIQEGVGHAIAVRTTLGSFTACGLRFEPFPRYARKTPGAICLACGASIRITPAKPERPKRAAPDRSTPLFRIAESASED